MLGYARVCLGIAWVYGYCSGIARVLLGYCSGIARVYSGLPQDAFPHFQPILWRLFSVWPFFKLKKFPIKSSDFASSWTCNWILVSLNITRPTDTARCKVACPWLKTYCKQLTAYSFFFSSTDLTQLNLFFFLCVGMRLRSQMRSLTGVSWGRIVQLWMNASECQLRWWTGRLEERRGGEKTGEPEQH